MIHDWLILILMFVVGLSSAIFGVWFANYYIVERRTRQTVKLIKNELLHSSGGEELMRVVEGVLKWRAEHGEEFSRDLTTTLRFIHHWAEQMRERERVKS